MGDPWEWAIHGRFIGRFMGTLFWFTLILAAGGAVAGFMAGLLGIGGGAVLVPVLYEVYGLLGIDEAIRTHMAVATSLAVIVPTGLRSAYGHNKKQSVDWGFVRLIAPFILIGVVLGSIIAVYANGIHLRLIYGVTVILVALFLLWSQNHPEMRFSWPSKWVTQAYGVFTGALSTLMGIGGGTFTGSYMTILGRSIHQAVGTAAAIGPLIALPATLGFIIGGWENPLLPPFSLGFVSLLGAALILPTSLLFAPFGVKAAHGLSKTRLEFIFALFLLFVGVRFLYSLVS